MGSSLLTVLKIDELLTLNPFSAALVPTWLTTRRMKSPAFFYKNFAVFRKAG
jgi:hypothetical protein